MKTSIFFISLLLLAFGSNGQSITPVGAAQTTRENMGGCRIDSFFKLPIIIPRAWQYNPDSIGNLGVRASDKALIYNNGTGYVTVNTGGNVAPGLQTVTGVDSTTTHGLTALTLTLTDSNAANSFGSCLLFRGTVPTANTIPIDKIHDGTVINNNYGYCTFDCNFNINNATAIAQLKDHGIGFQFRPVISSTGGGVNTLPHLYGYASFPTVGNNCVVTEVKGSWSENPAIVGNGRITNNYGVYCDNMTSGDNNYGLYITHLGTNEVWGEMNVGFRTNHSNQHATFEVAASTSTKNAMSIGNGPLSSDYSTGGFQNTGVNFVETNVNARMVIPAIDNNDGSGDFTPPYYGATKVGHALLGGGLYGHYNDGKMAAGDGLSVTASRDSITYTVSNGVYTATDANFVVPTGNCIVILPTISGSKAITFPDATTHTGQVIHFINTNATGNNWIYYNPPVLDPQTGSTISVCTNGATSDEFSDGTTWVKLR